MQNIFVRSLYLSMKANPIILFFWLATWSHSLWGQFVFPGDANRDGRVDNLDILYVGYAYGTAGPLRLSATTEFEAQTVQAYWPEGFPFGPNYIHADADGNGLIDWRDLLVVHNNYSLQHENYNPEGTIKNFGSVPYRLLFETEKIAANVGGGTRIEIPLTFGDSANWVRDFNGLAFSVVFPETYIQDLRIDFSEGWATSDSLTWSFQKTISKNGETQLDVALTRLGKNGIQGNGRIGVISMVIVDNLIEFLKADSHKELLQIKNVAFADTTFHIYPIVSNVLTVYHPDSLVAVRPAPTLDIQAFFPNPASDFCIVETSDPIGYWELRSLNGCRVAGESGIHSRNLQIQVSQYPPGLYYLYLRSGAKRTTIKLIIHKN